MKHYILIGFLSLGLIFGCKKDSTSSNDDDKNNSFTSLNVKTEGTQYYSFADNSAGSTKPQSWDLAFDLQVRTEEVGYNTHIYFTVPSDPVVKAGPGVRIARLEDTVLDSVTAVPSSEHFAEDDTTEEAVIGKDWFDAANSYAVRPDVYVVRTSRGSYGLVQFTGFDMDFSQMQISSIHFDYKYNDGVSTDFASTELDSSESGNAYEETRYFSFTDSTISAPYGTWELRFEGSAVWLGPNVEVHKLENTDINDVAVVQSDEFVSDILPFHSTSGWFDSDAAHKVIPKDIVFVAELGDGNYAAFQITNYYDDLGNSGAFTINWKYLE